MYSVMDGHVIPTPTSSSHKCQGRYDNKECIHSKNLEFQRQSKLPRVLPLNPKGYTATVKIRYDENFAARHGELTKAVIWKIMLKVMDTFLLDSLTTPVILKIDPIIDGVKGKFKPEPDSTVRPYADFSTEDYNINLMFAYNNVEESGPLLSSYPGSACYPAKYRFALCEFFQNETKTAEIVVRAIGRNLGILFDYNYIPGKTRYDNSGKKCAG